MSYNIIVEGPNNTGKSTFIRRLVSDPLFNDFEVEHVDSKAPNDYEFHDRLLFQDKNFIFDRFYIGETIYSEIYGRLAKISVEELVKLCTEHDSKSVVVIVDADFGFMSRAYASKGEEVDWSLIYKEKEMFWDRYKALSEAGVDVWWVKNHWDTQYGETTIDDVISHIKNKFDLQ